MHETIQQPQVNGSVRKEGRKVAMHPAVIESSLLITATGGLYRRPAWNRGFAAVGNVCELYHIDTLKKMLACYLKNIVAKLCLLHN